MRKRFLVVLFLLPLCLTTLSGCMSGIHQTTLVPRATPQPGIKGGPFTIAEVKLVKTWPAGKFGGEPMDIIPLSTPPKQNANASLYWSEDSWRKRMLEVAVQRHPALFSQSETAIPLAIDVNTRADNSLGYSIAAELLTVCALGGVLPLPVTSSADVQVTVRHAESRSAPAASHTMQFRRADKGWITIFTPLGIFPYPGHSDFPRTYMTIFQSAQEQEIIYKYVLESIVEAVVQVLERDPKAFLKRPHGGGSQGVEFEEPPRL